jgi:Uncharacterized protein conserved in bacteria
MLKKITNLFRKIAKSFDRYIVVPITRLVLKITGSFDKSGHKLENFLSKQTTLLFLSLFLAIALFIVVDQKILVLTTNGAEVIKDQKVEILYNEERFVITGAPETVDITLFGGKADLYIAKQTSKHNVKLDLTDIKEPGTYKVDIEYESGLPSIEYSVNPSQVTIVVYLKETKNQSLSYKVINADHLDSSVEISKVSLNIDQVVISGADFQLEKVATVEALIDVDKLTSTAPGTQKLEDIILKAYDKDGNVVDVEINKTAKVTANVEITSSSRTVSLNFVPVNEVPFGKAISSYSFSQETVVVYGPTDVLDELERTGIDILVDVSKLTADYSATVEIPKPNGIKKLSVNKITTTIRITDSGEPVTMTLKIDALNTADGLIAGAASPDDAEVLVDIKGARNIISGLRETEIQAYVDLSGYTSAGTYDVPIQIRANTPNARLATYVPKKATVKIVLKKN